MKIRKLENCKQSKSKNVGIPCSTEKRQKKNILIHWDKVKEIILT